MLNQHAENPGPKVCPFSGMGPQATPAPSPGACLDLIDVLDGLFTLGKRSATLDGSIPVRAAQGCKPLLDGNSVGFHLQPADPVVLRRNSEGPELILTDEGYSKATDDYAAKIDRLVQGGFLERDGYWHRKLRTGFAWREDDTFNVWTGHLVRPSEGTWMLASGAFNRRCPVDLKEFIIPDDSRFVPLVVRLDLASLRSKDTWLDTDLACLTPLRPNASFKIRSLRQEPEIGRAFSQFYSPSYLEPRSQGGYVGRYRKLTASPSAETGAGKADCRLVLFGGPEIHQIRTFERFATADGLSSGHPAQDSLQYAVIRNICRVGGRWDGVAVRDISAEVSREAQKIRNLWTELYGAEALPSIDWLTNYVHDQYGPNRGEPHLPITPWTFAVTPPGWSSIIDGFQLKNLDGMRGVVATDSYFGVPPLWHIQKPGRFVVEEGTPLARLLPAPRQLLESALRTVPLIP